ncbi:hypothetical protein BDV93DRAFT_515526 [Ceratobasidium sp. AG-I]|nr:hypothetical protein BDV93DRAFT_515526 [Ceratobasidium sp. AG-I]
MFSTAHMLCFVSTVLHSVGVFVSALLEFEYQQNLCHTFVKIIREGKLAFGLNNPVYSVIMDDIEASLRADNTQRNRLLSVPPCFVFKHHKIRSHESTSAPCSTPIRNAADGKEDADATVQGAIDMLNALVSGLGEKPLGGVEVTESAKILPVLSAPRMARSYARLSLTSSDISETCYELPSGLSTPDHVSLRLKETFETSKHNKNRLRATLARTKSIYAPGSCVRPSGQLPGSEARIVLHGSDGSLNVALYPKAMLVKLATFEGDGIVESAICDPEEVVCGAIERLSALVNGIGYDWVEEGAKRSTHLMRRGGSMESLCSTSTASTESYPVTPLDQVEFSVTMKC